MCPGKYEKRSVDLAYRTAVMSIAELIRFSKAIGLSPDVLPEILDIASDSVERLTSVDDFARFNVSFSPFPNISHLTPSMAKNGCRNGWACGRSKYPGEGYKQLVGPEDFTGENIVIFPFQLDIFPEKISESEGAATAVGGEGGIFWCIFDHVKIGDKVKTGCSGSIFAYDLNEAII